MIFNHNLIIGKWELLHAGKDKILPQFVFFIFHLQLQLKKKQELVTTTDNKLVKIKQFLVEFTGVAY